MKVYHEHEVLSVVLTADAHLQAWLYASALSDSDLGQLADAGLVDGGGLRVHGELPEDECWANL